MENIKNQDRKKVVLALRWTVIIVTCYLILLGRGRVTNLHLSYLLIFGYILSYDFRLNKKVLHLIDT